MAVDPWITNQDLNTIKVDVNDLRMLCVALVKDGVKDIGLLDLLFYIKTLSRSESEADAKV